jgi:hypothetical protein
MGTLNPYQAPLSPVDTASWAPCPKCGGQTATKVAFTWWGGAVGPRLFSVVKCAGCGTKYKGKTGGRLLKTIIIYQGVVVVVAAVLFYYLVYSR